MYKRIILTLIIATITACASTPDDELSDEDADKTAGNIYLEAKAALDAGDYETAIERLGTLESRFPFGRYAQQARLDMAFAYYKYDEPDSAISEADRFIKLYPRHPRVDYVYYLKGLVKFDQGQSFFDNLANLDPSMRDPSSAQAAFRYFGELVNRYPNSIYAEDAVQRMTYLRNNLARSEVHIADFYIRRGAYLAAANRAKYVLEYYHRTPSVPDALVIMVKAYRALKLHDLAADAQRVLALNFPKHPGLKELKGQRTNNQAAL